MSENPIITITKNWKDAGVFDSYEEALNKKNTITQNHSLVKIRRCGHGGHRYRVKFWDENPEPKNKRNKKKK